jgi:bacterioferritin B
MEARRFRPAPPTRTDWSAMLTDDLRKLLIQQIGSELTAHQQYMAISIWFAQGGLDRWAKLFRSQSMEEAQHAEKIMAFLVDNEVEFDVPALKGVPTRFKSASAAVATALESEQRVAAQFDRIAATALEKGDHRAHQFAQWFIEEQVEEEAKVQRLLDLVESGINLFQAEALLDGYE